MFSRALGLSTLLGHWLADSFEVLRMAPQFLGSHPHGILPRQKGCKPQEGIEGTRLGWTSCVPLHLPPVYPSLTSQSRTFPPPRVTSLVQFEVHVWNCTAWTWCRFTQCCHWVNITAHIFPLLLFTPHTMIYFLFTDERHWLYLVGGCELL